MFEIKKMRIRAGLSQQQAADALEIKKARYGDWERETHIVNLRDAIRVADLFNCTLDELAGREWPPPSTATAVGSLASDERDLIDLYRDTDARGKGAIMRTAEGEAGVEGQPSAGERRAG